MDTIKNLETGEPPREILDQHFPSIKGKLPIKGGWGYSMQDACVIDKNDEIVNPSLPFDGVGYEYAFIEKRNYEELIIFRPEGEQFSGIQYHLIKQELIGNEDKYYDHLSIEVTAFHDNDWHELKKEYEAQIENFDFDHEAHEQKRQEKIVKFEREFWFDITSFYKTEKSEIVLSSEQLELKEKYDSFEDYDLIELYKSGKLTNEAEEALVAALSERGISVADIPKISLDEVTEKKLNKEKNYFLDLIRGKRPLYEAFWIWGVLVNGVLKGIATKEILPIFFSIIFFSYALFSAYVILKNRFNTESKLWRYLATGVAIYQIVFVGSLFFALIFK